MLFTGSLSLHAQQITATYTANGTFTVPTCVTAVTFTAHGAKGGSTDANMGGNGGIVSGQFTVAPGQIFQIRIGEPGGDPVSYCPPGGPCTSTPGVGGNNGGGDGQNGYISGAGGGGASDIRQAPFTLSDRFVVAAGGGGAGAHGSTINAEKGGSGGGLTGENGSSVILPGNGGTQTAGGTGGSTVLAVCNGSFGIGGTGVWSTAGGGGGGGWYGGGGGAWGGGGGGSNYAAAFVTAVMHSRGVSAGAGSVTLSYHIGSAINIVNSPPAICAGGTIALAAPPGLATYSWNTSATTQSIVVSPSTSQTYSFAGLMNNGCVATGSAFIHVNTAPPVLTVAANSTTICPGKAVTLAAAGGVTYTWNNGVTQGVPFSPSVTNTYFVTGQNGCGTASAAITVVVAPLAVNISAGSNSVCAGQTVTLVAATSASSYSWTPYNNSFYTGGTYAVTPLATTVYSLSAGDGTCTGTATRTIQVHPLPVVSVAASETTVCAGSQVTLVASGGSSYTWSPGGSSGPSLVVQPVTNSQYFVVASSQAGCSSVAARSVFTRPTPAVFAGASTGYVCPGNLVTLFAAGAGSFTWTGGPSSGIYQVTPTISTVYTVTGTGGNGCTASQTTAVNVNALNLVITQDVPACIGKPVVLSASAADSYSWNDVPGGSTYTIYPLQTTDYTLTATSTSLGLTCRFKRVLSIQPEPSPTITLSGLQSFICVGDNIVLNAGGASSYSWTSMPVVHSGTGSSIVLNSAAFGLISYTITGASPAGCTGTTSATYVVTECTEIGTNHPGDVFSIYPNPVRERLWIRCTTEIRLIVFDVAGKEIKAVDVRPDVPNSIGTSELSPGIYLIADQQQPTTFTRFVISD